MVTRALRLRVALLASPFRGSALRAFGAGLRVLLAFGLAVAVAWLPALIAGSNETLRDQLDVVIASLVPITFGAVTFFTGRGHVDPRMFAPYPVTPVQIAGAVLLTTPVTWSMMWVAVWIVLRAAMRPEWWAAPWAVVVSSLLTFVAVVVAVRVMSGLSRLLFADGAAATVRRVLAVLVTLAVLPLAVFAVTMLLRDDDSSLGDAARVLAWFPAGSATQGLMYAMEGAFDLTVLHWAASVATVAVAIGVWFSLVTVAVTSIPRPPKAGVAPTGLGWFEYFRDQPAQVIAARTLTYWRRDPRYGVSLWAVPVAPLVMLGALAIAGVDWRLLVLLPLPVMLFLLGWSIHNDVAMDSTAVWLHVTSGISGRADRIGRLAPVFTLGLPLLLLGSSITVTLMGSWQVLPAVLGANAAILLIAAGVSSVMSARWPYPSTRPGESPFTQPQWSGVGAGLAQTGSVIVALVLWLPALWTSIVALREPVSFSANMVALVVGVVSGLIVLWVSVMIGGRVFDRSGPEIVAVTEIYD